MKGKSDREQLSDQQLASLLLAMCANSLTVGAASDSDISRADDVMRKAVDMRASCSYASLPSTLEATATCMLIWRVHTCKRERRHGPIED